MLKFCARAYGAREVFGSCSAEAGRMKNHVFISFTAGENKDKTLAECKVYIYGAFPEVSIGLLLSLLVCV